MKALITGASGQVGRALLDRKPPQAEVRAFTRDELDITDRSAVLRAVRDFAPAVVINAAAYTAVDRAEQDAEIAMAVNAAGPRHLAEAVRDFKDARLLHISTDYVFDGSGTRARRPEDPTGPLSVYGHTKLAGERAVVEVLAERAAVLRTAWIYAAEGKNFLLTMLRLMAERGTVRVVADQRGSPTAANSVATALWRISEKSDIHGVLHWTDAGTASWYEFARAIAEEAAVAGLLKEGVEVWPITTAEFPTPARRPMNSVLDVTKSAVQLDLQPVPWREDLRATLHLLAQH